MNAPAVPFSASEQYLAEADEAGCLFELDGSPYVAGISTDPVSGAEQCLVTFAAPELLSHPAPLLRTLISRFPDCRSVVVRTAGEQEPDPLFEPMLTYLRYDAPAAPAPPAAGGVRVTRSDSGEHDDRVASWISRALRDGSADLGRVAVEPAVELSTQEIMRAPSRRTYLAWADDMQEPIGHGTVLADETDEASGTPFVELVDILIDHAEHRAAATEQLVRVIAAEAAAHSLPVIGNVVHSPGSQTDPGAKIVASLQARGWQPVFRYRVASRARIDVGAGGQR
ncbi:hypothetical protein [Streptomyces sp. NPDC054765]